MAMIGNGDKPGPVRQRRSPSAALRPGLPVPTPGPFQLPPECPIGWQPGPLTPVFFGVRDYDTFQGAPSRLRVFYPSVDGSSSGASILEGCGHYPLLLF